MRRNSNLMLVFAVAFFFVGAAIVYLVVRDDEGDGATTRVSGERTVTVVSTTEDIAAGTVGADLLDAGTLVTEQVAENEAPADAISSVGELQTAIFAVAVPADSAITRGAIVTRSVADIEIPDGFEAVAVQVDFVAGGARYVGVGDRINLFGVVGVCDRNTIDTANGIECPPFSTPRVDLVLTNVLVLDVDRQDATALAQSSATTVPASGGTTITRETSATPITFLLALKTGDAERAIFYTSFADLYVSKVDADAPPAGETPGVDYTNSVDPRSADSAAG